MSVYFINQESRVRQERLNAGKLKAEMMITDTGCQQVVRAATATATTTTTTTTTTEKKDS